MKYEIIVILPENENTDRLIDIIPNVLRDGNRYIEDWRTGECVRYRVHRLEMNESESSIYD